MENNELSYQEMYNQKRKELTKRVNFTVALDFWEIVEKHLQEMDFSTAGYIQLALLDRMEKDGVDVSDFKFVNVGKNRYKLVNIKDIKS